MCTTGILFQTGCKKSTNIAFTNADAKPIFDKYCASCHASGKANAGDWLYDASDYDGSIKGSINDIYQTVYVRRSMPRGSSISAAELTKFKAWYDAGYPTN